MKIKYLFIVLLILVNCTALELNNSELGMTTDNNSELGMTKDIISEEIWHWCFGSAVYIFPGYIITDYEEDYGDYTDLRKLTITYKSASTLWGRKYTNLEINGEDWINFSLEPEKYFVAGVIDENEEALGICKIWFNINNP